MNNMKLFVVGSNSPNPDEWSDWESICIVLAETKEQAVELADLYSNEVCELSTDQARVLLTRFAKDESKDW